MKQVNVSFRKGDLEELKLLADADEVTVGAVVRDAVRDYLEERSNEIEKLLADEEEEEDEEEEKADTEEDDASEDDDEDDEDDEDDDEEDEED